MKNNKNKQEQPAEQLQQLSQILNITVVTHSTVMGMLTLQQQQMHKQQAAQQYLSRHSCRQYMYPPSFLRHMYRQ